MARRGPPSAAFGIALDVSGDEAIVKSFTDMGSALRNRVRATLVDLSEEILAREKAGMRSRTGATRESFDYDIREDARGIRARIGWWRSGGPGGTGWKAIFQESGVKGPVWMKRYVRGSRGGYVRKTIITKNGRKRRIKLIEGGWWRKVNIRAQPFVAPAWNAIKPRVQATLEAAIEMAKREAGLAS